MRNVISFCAIAIALGVATATLSACQSQQQETIQHEDNLAAAGFMVRIANTAGRQAMLHRLPPNRFVQRSSGGVTHYIYADPVACGCLYIGSQKAFDQYMADRQADFYGQEKLAAESFDDAAWNWAAWGPWGPLGPVYGPGPGW